MLQPPMSGGTVKVSRSALAAGASEDQGRKPLVQIRRQAVPPQPAASMNGYCWFVTPRWEPGHCQEATSIRTNYPVTLTAVRECWEETGLLIQLIGLVGVFGGPKFLIKYKNGDLTYYTVIGFHARWVAGEGRPDRC